MTRPGMAVIVGHGAGVGDATARAFGQAGHPVALIARRPAAVEAAAGELRALGMDAAGFTADAGDVAALQVALEAAKGWMGTPGVLVYNAAYWRSGPMLDLTPADFEADYRTCVVGAFAAARWAVPMMREAGGGSLLFTGGGLALHPSADAPTLSIGKGAIRALALMLADEVAGAGIRVGTVTIAGQVGAPTLPASRVADAFLDLHRGAPDRSTAEIVLRP